MDGIGMEILEDKKQDIIDTYNLTEEQFDELQELLINTSHYKGWNRPEVLRLDETKGYVKGNVIIVSGLFFDCLEKIRNNEEV